MVFHMVPNEGSRMRTTDAANFHKCKIIITIMIFASIKKAKSISGIFLCKKRPSMSDFDHNQSQVKTVLICLTICELNIADDE